MSDTMKEFIITRTVNAPRDIVWKAMTDPAEFCKWFGPKGFKGTAKTFVFKPGGMYHYSLQSPDGKLTMWGKLVYKEIEAPKRLVYINSFSDETGALARHPLSASWPLEMHTTVLLDEEGEKTKVTIKWIPINETEEERTTFNNAHEDMERGWSGTFDQLDEYIDAIPFVIERTFNAPIHHVWKAITHNEEMKKWYFVLPEFSAKVGFKFEFSAGPIDKPYMHLCKVTEVVKGKKITYTWRYDKYEGNSAVTWELFEEGKKTRLKLTHTGLETFPKDNPDFAKKSFAEGWTSILDQSLKKFLER